MWMGKKYLPQKIRRENCSLADQSRPKRIEIKCPPIFVSVIKSCSKMTYPQSGLKQMPMKRMRTMAMQRNLPTRFTRRSTFASMVRHLKCSKGPQDRKLEAHKLNVDDLEAEEQLRRAL